MYSPTGLLRRALKPDGESAATELCIRLRQPGAGMLAAALHSLCDASEWRSKGQTRTLAQLLVVAIRYILTEAAPVSTSRAAAAAAAASTTTPTSLPPRGGALLAKLELLACLHSASAEHEIVSTRIFG